ncbi:zinc finger C2HC domain-containing protein 1C [Archocentrus centrarchus]|uniref:zinc finger C2HC domain-containing protein 1C n=1 Tax=Archocentrus centrarchus TaxID=63155 RepID=UPI0011EA30F0|nr:zinc finger C2HC domain-containing protein 1C [Archocentrus centrarchus]XP_030574845.1 zinc finger C2HC domain-containing protein 1C [Archocentrus centrarchus]
MHAHIRRRNTSQGQHSFAGQRHGMPNREADAVNHPFPDKPVSHIRSIRSQVAHNLDDFENKVSTQPIAPLLPQKHYSDGITGTIRPSHRLPHGEQQMAKAIRAKELMLQEKLWKFEDTLRQRIQRDSADSAGGNEKKRWEVGYNRGQAQMQKAQTNTRIPELQFGEPARGRDKVTQDRRHVDFQQPGHKQDQRTEDRMRHTKEAQQVVSEAFQPNRKANKSTQEIIFNKQEVNGELNRSRWQNVKEHTRGKEGHKDGGIQGEAEKIKYSEKNMASVGNSGWMRENKHRGRMHKEQDIPQKSLQRTACTVPSENHRHATLPSDSSPSHCSGPQQGELMLTESTQVSRQLFLCRVCSRKFASERLEKHVQICEKVKKSHRQVFNSFINRTKGSVLEEYLKTSSRSKSPEALKKKTGTQNRKGNISNLPQARLQAATSQPKRASSISTSEVSY